MRLSQASKDKVDALFNSVLSADDAEDAAPITFIKDLNSAHLRYPVKHWLVDEVNVSTKFYEYRELIKEGMKSAGEILETHVDEFLAMSSILLLKPKQYARIMLDHFSQKHLDKIQKAHLASHFKESAVVFDDDLFRKNQSHSQGKNCDEDDSTRYEAPFVSDSNVCKSDDVAVLLGLKKQEILLLEASGTVTNLDKTKVNFDHHKEVYGLQSQKLGDGVRK